MVVDNGTAKNHRLEFQEGLGVSIQMKKFVCMVTFSEPSCPQVTMTEFRKKFLRVLSGGLQRRRIRRMEGPPKVPVLDMTVNCRFKMSSA